MVDGFPKFLHSTEKEEELQSELQDHLLSMKIEAIFATVLVGYIFQKNALQESPSFQRHSFRWHYSSLQFRPMLLLLSFL